MSASQSDLRAEETALRACLLAYTDAATAYRELSGAKARVKEFWIGRTKVVFQSQLEIAQAIRETQKSLTEVRRQLRIIAQNSQQFQQTGGGVIS